MKYNNCFIIKTLQYHLSDELIDKIYNCFITTWNTDIKTFHDYLVYLYCYYVEDIEIFYSSLPDLYLYEETSLLDALDELFF